MLTVSSAGNLALSDLFIFTVDGCLDEDQPLTYRYTFYTSHSLYKQDIVNGSTLSLNSLSDYMSQNSFTTYLVQPTYSELFPAQIVV